MLLGVLCLAASSCQRKEILEFGGHMDQFTATDADGQKTYLGHAEEWIYWEADDKIKINDGSSTSECTLISGANTLDAFFKSETTVNTGGELYAIYPSKSYGSTYTDLIFPATQQYRQNSNGTHPDSSFGRGALPMVAFSTDGMAHHGTLYFHVVAGILRVQILSSDTKEIDWIKFTEVGSAHGSSDKQISGHFEVHSINRNMPWLTANGGTTPSVADRTITITDINQPVGPTQLLTFYLPLPAVGTSSANEYTQYILRMTIKAKDENKYFTRDFKADIHRRNITMMRAIEVRTWANSEGEGSDSDVKLVGSGTKDRPFQIYTGKELGLLRNVYNNGGTINGQTIKGYTPSAKDEATYIKIVRSDIELLNSTDYAALSSDERNNPNSRFVEWTEGIENFRGYMYFASSTATNGGITNRSNSPLFKSIATDGYVYRVYVKSKPREAADVAVAPTVADGAVFSPMCGVNNGTMEECHNKCRVTLSNNAHLAGLCVTNNGSIIGGANEAQLTTEGNVAGICYNNNGMIQGNFTLSVAMPQGRNIAGIAYNNIGTGSIVKDCQVSSNINVNSTGNWGVVVFNNNSGAIIDNCSSTGTVVYTINGSVGGICNINEGTVKNCTNNVEIRAGSTNSAGVNVGGVVATMNNVNAEVYNCCTKAPYLYGAIDASRVAENCGGVVGQLVKGKVYNCYNASYASGATNSGGLIGNLFADDVDVQNCWSAQGQGFVGKYEEGATVGDFCFSASVLLATKCNHIRSGSVSDPNLIYTIIDMQQNQTLNNNIDPNYYVGKHVGKALNKWVDLRNDGRDYYRWVDTITKRPDFKTGINIVNQKKGRRR